MGVVSVVGNGLMLLRRLEELPGLHLIQLSPEELMKACRSVGGFLRFEYYHNRIVLS